MAAAEPEDAGDAKPVDTMMTNTKAVETRLNTDTGGMNKAPHADDSAGDATKDHEADKSKLALVQGHKQPIREELVNTAVHFLQNPKVQSSSLVQKRAFLLKKGLTSEEVDVAIDRSGLGQLKKYGADTGHFVSHQAPLPPVINPGQNALLPVRRSVWAKAYDLLSFAVTVGGVCYGAILIYKRYVEPRLANTKRPKQIDVSVENQLLELNEAVSQLQQSLQEVQKSLKKQQEVLNEILCPDFKNKDLVNKIQSPTEAILTDLKSEIGSIKSLLLSRRQFPASPLVNPSIPSWQLTNGDSCEESANEKITVLEDGPANDSTAQGTDKEAEEAEAAAAVVLNGTTSDC